LQLVRVSADISKAADVVVLGPISGATVVHDRLIPEILRREAEQTITK
jgi:hypothetical protein